MKNTKTYQHMIPKDLISKIRCVVLHHYHNGIYGFSFFDKDGALLWKHGWTTFPESKEERVLINENERIVGVRATLVNAKSWFGIHQSAYNNFQFQLGKKLGNKKRNRSMG